MPHDGFSPEEVHAGRRALPSRALMLSASSSAGSSHNSGNGNGNHVHGNKIVAGDIGGGARNHVGHPGGDGGVRDRGDVSSVAKRLDFGDSSGNSE